MLVRSLCPEHNVLLDPLTPASGASRVNVDLGERIVLFWFQQGIGESFHLWKPRQIKNKKKTQKKETHKDQKE